MVHKVKYIAFAKMTNGSIGNLVYNSGTVYTDCSLEELEVEINKMLERLGRREVCDIIKVEKIDGRVLAIDAITAYTKLDEIEEKQEKDSGVAKGK